VEKKNLIIPALENESRKEQSMSTASTTRTRTFSWEDPAPALQESRAMSGIEYLRAVLAGELPPPPVAALIDMGITEVGEGRVVFTAVPAEYHYNPLGTVHGGIISTLLDSSLGCAVQTLLSAGTSYTTLELKVNYVRPVTSKSGTLYSEGKVIHMGGRIATAEARLTDASGKLYAHATTTCIVLRP
jgi:uncharacterized protein (TIGR00369 family)